MKQKFKVNVGNFQNITIETSDLSNIVDLMLDVKLQFNIYMHIPEVEQYYIKFIKQAISKVNEIKVKK